MICVEDLCLYRSICHLAFSYRLEPLVFLDNDLLSFGYSLIRFFSVFDP